MNLLDKILEVKVKLTDGISIHEQVIRKYIETNMRLKIVDYKEKIKYDDFDHAEIVAKNSNNTYEFYVERYPLYIYSPEEYQIELRAIESNNKEHKLSLRKIFYTSFFKQEVWNEYEQSLIEMTGDIDSELTRVIEMLNNKLNNYSFIVTKKVADVKNSEPIIIDIEDKVKIRQGFSNTIQFNLEKLGFNDVGIIFRKVSEDKLDNELTQVFDLIQKVLDGHLELYGIELFELKRRLTDFRFDDEKPYIRYNSDGVLRVLEGKSREKSLITDFGLGEYESMKEIKLKLYYDNELDQLELNMNYMLDEFNEVFDSVDSMFGYLNTVKAYLE